MKKFFNNIFNYFNICERLSKENEELLREIINLKREKDEYKDKYYRMGASCTTCEWKTRDNDRFQKEVIVLKQLIEEKNLVIDKLTSLEYNTKELNNVT